MAGVDVGHFSLLSHAPLLHFFTAEEVKDKDWQCLIFTYLSPDKSDIDEMNSGLPSQKATDPVLMGDEVFPQVIGICFSW